MSPGNEVNQTSSEVCRDYISIRVMVMFRKKFLFYLNSFPTLWMIKILPIMIKSVLPWRSLFSGHQDKPLHFYGIMMQISGNVYLKSIISVFYLYHYNRIMLACKAFLLRDFYLQRKGKRREKLPCLFLVAWDHSLETLSSWSIFYTMLQTRVPQNG